MRDEEKTQEQLISELLALRHRLETLEQAQAEQPLRGSEDRLKAFLDNSPVPAWIKDDQFRYVYRNQRSELRFQKSHEECRGKTVFEVWPKTVAQTMWETDQAVLASDQPAQFQESLPTPDGQMHHWLVYKFPFRDAEGHRFVAGMAVDLTEQKQAEESLRNSEALYHSLVDCLPQSIFRKSLDGRFTFANQRFCNTLGMALEHILGKTDYDFYPEELARKYRQDDERVAVSREILAVEEEHELADGKRICVEVIKSPVYDARGQIVGTQCIFWDITERKRLEEQLLNAQKLKAVGQLAGGIAHDFRNLLTAIIGNATLAEEESPPSLRPLIAEMLKASNRAVGLVNQLLTFSRQMPLHIGPTALNPIIREVVDIARKTFDKRIEISVEGLNAEVHVQADANQIHQALLNLCINARDALESVNRQDNPHLEIKISVATVDIGEEYRTRHLEAKVGRFARVAITDTGIGMDKETQQRVFEPFFTTKAVGKGTGLGLSTTYGMVEQHGGWIEVESQVGQGTTVALHLPLAEAVLPGNGVNGRPEEKLAGGTETILVVDDEDMIRRLGRQILSRYGYTLLEASDGQAAVDRFVENNGAVDLVLLDLSMPRLSGEEALTRLRLLNHRA